MLYSTAWNGTAPHGRAYLVPRVAARCGKAYHHQQRSQMAGPFAAGMTLRSICPPTLLLMARTPYGSYMPSQLQGRVSCGGWAGGCQDMKEW